MPKKKNIEFRNMLDAQSVEETRLALKERRYGEVWKIALAEDRIRRGERYVEARRELERKISGLAEKSDNLRSGLLRLAILGNAGGAIATLSFMGTISGSGGTFGYSALAILVCFLIGLVSGGCAREVDWEITSATHEDAIKLLMEGGTDEDLYGYPSILGDRMWRLIIICFAALGSGTITGLVQLAIMVPN